MESNKFWCLEVNGEEGDECWDSLEDLTADLQKDLPGFEFTTKDELGNPMGYYKDNQICAIEYEEE